MDTAMRFSTMVLAAGLLTVAGSALAQKMKQGKPAAKPAAAAAAKYDEAKLTALEAKLAKSPKDAKLKLQVAEASYQVGHYVEYDKPGLTPREKYRGALKLYRRALALNPAHKQAKAEKDQIEAIYKQMGMPIPQ
jgi:hypothetical protein